MIESSNEGDVVLVTHVTPPASEACLVVIVIIKVAFQMASDTVASKASCALRAFDR